MQAKYSKRNRFSHIHWAILCICSIASTHANSATEIDRQGIFTADPVLGSQANINRRPQSSLYSSHTSQQEAAELEIEQAQRQQDIQNNLNSDVFGTNLFTGAFSGQGAASFNPNYAIAPGDQIQLRLWGAFDLDAILEVDPKGNIFIPGAGPISVVGVANKDLQSVVDRALKKMFRSNVFSYASLAAAQPVRVFVTGFVNRPGLYRGTSMDSLLHYLDQAGGIAPDKGSFRRVDVTRNGTIRQQIDLYDFLLRGQMPLVQFADGDTIVVSSLKHTVSVSGLVQNPNRFEFRHANRSVSDVLRLASPDDSATHIRLTRNSGNTRNVDYFPLSEAPNIRIDSGDSIEVTADKRIGTITVRVEGAHSSAQEYVLPANTRLKTVLEQVTFTADAEQNAIQLYRQSVQSRQKELLETSLRSLETAALTARSGTNDEANLRREEAELILRWVERAREIEPNGRVVLGKPENYQNLILENGDLIEIPTRDGLVLVSGEVLFPNAITHNARRNLKAYIELAGGFTQNADSARVIIARIDGSYVEVSARKSLFGRKYGSVEIQPGDEILVLPKIHVKSRQIFKDMTQILFQLAVSARVVLGL